MTSISIIVATRDRWDSLRGTLDCVDLVAPPPGTKTEVVIVDNASVNPAPPWVCRTLATPFPRRLLHQKDGGKSEALNAALSASASDIVVLLDDDVRPCARWLCELTRPILDGRSDAVAGWVRIADHLLRPWMTDTHRAWLASTEYLDPLTPESAVGANMAFVRSVLRSVPGFDPELGPGRLGLWEDTLFSLQLRKAGYRLAGAPGAVVEHHFDPGRLTRDAFIKRATAEARSSAYVAWHWEHRAPSPDRSGKVRSWRARLAVKRALDVWDRWRREGIPTWELNLLCGIEFERSLACESARVRAYARHGIHKLSREKTGHGALYAHA